MGGVERSEIARGAKAAGVLWVKSVVDGRGRRGTSWAGRVVLRGEGLKGAQEWSVAWQGAGDQRLYPMTQQQSKCDNLFSHDNLTAVLRHSLI